jgi:general secretion pathway protein A
MYTAFYGLREKPFSLTPDPRYLFLSTSHREALAHVLYGLEQGEGFIAITGEVGTGKTTLCRTLLQRLRGDTEIAFVFNPTLTGKQLLSAICNDFGLATAGRTRAQLNDQLNQFLLETNRRGRRALLIVDEAQDLAAETLEELRLLSNLETTTSKLIQILLFGQPELDEKLDSRQLRQLRQRISVRSHLHPMSARETREYVRHRLAVAASEPRELFRGAALREVQRRSRGIPRLVNLLCERALLAGYAEGAARVEARHVTRAALEILARRGRRWRRRLARHPGAIAAAALLCLALLGALAWQRQSARAPLALAPALPAVGAAASAGSGPGGGAE